MGGAWEPEGVEEAGSDVGPEAGPSDEPHASPWGSARPVAELRQGAAITLFSIWETDWGRATMARRTYGRRGRTLPSRAIPGATPARPLPEPLH